MLTKNGIEHSENEIIGYSENKAGPVVLESSVQQTCYQAEFLVRKIESKDNE